MAMTVEPLAETFGVRISGVDVRRLTEAERDRLVDAANTSGVVHVPDQSLTDEEQIAFTETFGPLRLLRVNKARASKRPPGIVEISNVDADGNLIPPDSDVLRFSKGNRLWHSDYSYTAEHAAQSVLYAEEAAESGGETEFADMAAAHDALPPEEQRRLATMTATHDRFHSRIKSGFTDFTAEDYARTPPAKHPLVSVHPVTGRRSLLIGSHVSAIDGMSEPETESLVAELLAHATQPRFVYRHRWSPGDVIVWDNRSTLHRGRPADPSERRVMRRTAAHNAPQAATAAAH